MYIGSRNQLDKCESKEIHVRNDLIPRCPLVKYLGAWINELLTFKHHTNMKCKTTILNLMRIQYLRQHLGQATCEILKHSLLMSCSSGLHEHYTIWCDRQGYKLTSRSTKLCGKGNPDKFEI